MNIAIVAHDSGAANLILGFIKNNTKNNYYFYLKGPAKKIFEESYKSFKNRSIKFLLDNCDVLISGTGWQSDFEHLARCKFKKRNKKIISVIDHWVNYKERFENEDQNEFLSDEIWVFDKTALKIAKKTFPDILIIEQKNFYVHDIVEKINQLGNHGKYNSILYVLEPIRDGFKQKDGDEFKCIDYFFKKISKFNINYKEIIFRPHPSENDNKYDSFLSLYENDFKIKIDKKSSLEKLISKSSVVVGYGSMAMYIADKAGKKIISSRMPYHPPLNMPIQNLHDLKKLAF